MRDPVRVALGVPETLAPLTGLSSLCSSIPASLTVSALTVSMPLSIPNIPALRRLVNLGDQVFDLVVTDLI
jgi:hypothetical protein